MPSKKLCEAVMLHVGNILPSVPVTYSTTLKEHYGNLSNIMDSIHYECHQWYICADLKVFVVVPLIGLQTGYTKYCCFLWLWDLRARARQCMCRVATEWHWGAMKSIGPQRKSFLTTSSCQIGWFKLFNDFLGFVAGVKAIHNSSSIVAFRRHVDF